MLNGGEHRISNIRAKTDRYKKIIGIRDVTVVQRGAKKHGNKGIIIDTLCNRTKKQHGSIDAGLREKTGSCLLTMVTDSIPGCAGTVIRYFLMETDARGAEFFTIATEGSGKKDDALIDIVNTYSNSELAAIVKKWEMKNGKTTHERLESEPSRNARELMAILLFGEKSESEHVDCVLATGQAADLHAASAQTPIGADGDVFHDILGRQSRAQIQAIKTAFEKNYGMSLMERITNCFSGTYQKGLLACLFPTSEAYIAFALHEAMVGMGTRDSRVARLLGGTDRSKMAAVAACYLDVHGKSLDEALKGDLSGTFLKAALGLISGTDPTGGLESLTAETLASRGPSNGKDLVTNLIQMCDNLEAFICKMDAKDIYEACKGLGTRNAQLFSIICGRTKQHLAQVDKEYHSLFNKSLEAEVRSECTGDYRDLLVYTVLPEADCDALLLHKALGGRRTKEGLIVFVLAPQSNTRILAAKARHDQKKYSKPLIDRLNSALSGAFKDLVLAVIKGERQEDEVDEGLAARQAKELHEAGIGKRMGTDEKVFIRILSQASRPQIKLIRQHYESNHGMRLERAIEKELKGSFKEMLLAVIEDPAAYYARELSAAFKRRVTDTAKVARILGGNDKPMIDQIAECYRSNNEDTLVADVRRKTTGNFRLAAVTLLGNKDGFSGAENGVVVHRQEAENNAPVPRLVEPSAPDAPASPPLADHGGDDGGSASGSDDGSPEGQGKGYVHGIADKAPVPPFTRSGDASNGGRSGAGAAPEHRGSQVTTSYRRPPPPYHESCGLQLGHGNTTVAAEGEKTEHHDNGNKIARALDTLSVNGPYGDGSPAGEGKGSVHGVADEGAVPPFIGRGDVSNGGRSGEEIAPVCWSTQPTASPRCPPPPPAYYVSSTLQADAGDGTTTVASAGEKTEHHDNGNKTARVLGDLSVNGPCGDVSNGGRSGGGVAPVHRSTQSTTFSRGGQSNQLPQPTAVYYRSPTRKASGGASGGASSTDALEENHGNGSNNEGDEPEHQNSSPLPVHDDYDDMDGDVSEFTDKDSS